MKNRINCLFAFFAVLLCAVMPIFSQEQSQVQIVVNGDFFYDIPMQDGSSKDVMGEIQKGLGAGLGLEVRPWKHVGILSGMEYHTFSLKEKSINSYDTISFNLGAGARIPLRGAITLNADILGGVYSTSHESSSGKMSYSGIGLGARVSLRYNFSPSIGMGIGTGYMMNRHNDFSISYIPVNLGVSLNLTELQSAEQKVTGDIFSLDPVFPSLYSWYAENGFGKAVVENFEAEEITNIRVYFYMEQFQNQRTLCGTIPHIKPGKKGVVDLKAIFNPSILTVSEKSDSKANIIVEYNRLGKRFRVETPVTIPVYNANAMSWDDDRRAAVYVSKNNSVTVEFAKHVASAVRPLMNEARNENLQLAQALFGALSEYGMRYIVDPSSSYSANVGTVSIDFLQFPHQTLKYKAGDCDDLSILYCSLLESLGIESAFITVPGHIYAAFSLDMNEEEGRKVYTEQEAIFYGGRTWIPVEVTMTQDTFAAARKYGINEWNKYVETDNSRIYPMHDNWKDFKSVNVSQEGFEVKVPSRERIQARFR